MNKEQMTWRSISSRAVASQWNAGTPTYYVLDGKGVIRYKWVGSPGEKAIDTALEKLLHEAENSTKKRRGSAGKTSRRCILATETGELRRWLLGRQERRCGAADARWLS